MCQRRDIPRALPPTRKRANAFTLVEAMVVVIIIGILAGMAVVRMGSDIRRRRDLTAVKIEALLETLAHRHITSQDRIALSYDPVERMLFLERLIQQDELEIELEPEWRRDLLALPVIFEDDDILLDALSFDGRPQSLGSFFRWEIMPGEMRPIIEIDIVWGEEVDLIQLLPHELHPTRYGIGLEDVLPPLEPIDLDEIGKDDESW